MSDSVIELRDSSNEIIFVNGDIDGTYVSVLACGYIIAKSGEFINLGKDHGESLSDFYYLYHYREGFSKKRLSTFEIIPKLVSEGFIVFIGSSKTKVYSNLCSDLGFGLLLLPDELTEEQKKSCKKLLDSNRQVLNPQEKKIRIEYGSGVDMSINYTEEEVEKMLQPCKKTHL